MCMSNIPNAGKLKSHKTSSRISMKPALWVNPPLSVTCWFTSPQIRHCLKAARVDSCSVMFTVMVASRPMAPPSAFPEMAEQILTDVPLEKYSDAIWSAYVQQLLTVENRFAQIEMTSATGTVTQHAFEMRLMVHHRRRITAALICMYGLMKVKGV